MLALSIKVTKVWKARLYVFWEWYFLSYILTFFYLDSTEDINGLLTQNTTLQSTPYITITGIPTYAC